MDQRGISFLYLNIYDGCREPGRYRRLVSFVKKRNPDVLGLSELNGWDENDFARLSDFKKEVKLDYSLFCRSPHGYHLAVFSRIPFIKATVLNEGMWHGAIVSELSTKGRHYEVAIAHLSPRDEGVRTREAKSVVSAIRMKSAILMGDMNSLSREDIRNPGKLMASLRSKGISKFGPEKPRSDTIDAISKKMVDATRLFSKVPGHTVPTKSNRDQEHSVPVRLDYVFITPDLKPHVKAAGILRTSETERISDHYPIFLDLKGVGDSAAP